MTVEPLGVTIIYDGDCPLCHRYVAHLRLQHSAGAVRLVNARQHPELSAALATGGVDLDSGLLVQLGEQRYHGAEALHVLSLMSGRNDFFNRLNYRLFRSRRLAGLLYPLLVAGRRVLLRLLRRGPLIS